MTVRQITSSGVTITFGAEWGVGEGLTGNASAKNLDTVNFAPCSFTVYLYNQEGKVTSPSELTTTPVAITSFNYNIAIEPGDIVEGTLEMLKSAQ